MKNARHIVANNADMISPCCLQMTKSSNMNMPVSTKTKNGVYHMWMASAYILVTMTDVAYTTAGHNCAEISIAFLDTNLREIVTATSLKTIQKLSV